MYIYIYIYIYKIYICCAFLGLDNKLYKIHGTYIEISDRFSARTRSLLLLNLNTGPV